MNMGQSNRPCLYGIVLHVVRFYSSTLGLLLAESVSGTVGWDSCELALVNAPCDPSSSIGCSVSAGESKNTISCIKIMIAIDFSASARVYTFNSIIVSLHHAVRQRTTAFDRIAN